jgi:hypothetical protein
VKSAIFAILLLVALPGSAVAADKSPSPASEIAAVLVLSD